MRQAANSWAVFLIKTKSFEVAFSHPATFQMNEEAPGCTGRILVGTILWGLSGNRFWDVLGSSDVQDHVAGNNTHVEPKPRVSTARVRTQKRILMKHEGHIISNSPIDPCPSFLHSPPQALWQKNVTSIFH